MMGDDRDYIIVSDADFSDEENAVLNADAEEAERGYPLGFLESRRRGRPLEIGLTPARHKVQVRLDENRFRLLNEYARRHHLSQSEAMRELLDRGLASA
ncbi:ribbon-helix-helix protein, CopG family [Bifidobacterium primatium]|nr:ribbon-helix-helix protein, CopG family [Bifidobacterium primatium]